MPWFMTGQEILLHLHSLAADIQDRMHDYVKLVCTEIKATARMNSGPLQTVYFGGGVRAGSVDAHAALR